MNLKKFKLSELTEFEGNYNKHPEIQIEHLKRSLTDFSQVKNVVVWKGKVVCGNGLVQAARALGWDEIQAVDVSDLTKKQAKALLIADNKTAEMALPDNDLLKELLADFDDPLADIPGLTDEFLKDLNLGFDNETQSDAEPQIDMAKELNEKWNVKSGDLFAIGNHRLLCGDCTVKEDVDRLMNGEKSDICFTSPPYNLGGNVSLRTKNKKESAYIDTDDNITDAEYIILLEKFTKNVLSYVEYAIVNLQFLAGNKRSVLEYLWKFNKHFADISIWVKSNPPPATAKNVMNSAFECLFFLSAYKNPTRAITTADFRGTVSNVFYGSVNSENIVPEIHNATFPLTMAKEFISNFSKESVFDCFLGSGTTMVAAQNLNRRCFGMEISETYCAVILDRMEKAFPDIKIERLD